MLREALAAAAIATLGLAACETAPTPYQPAGDQPGAAFTILLPGEPPATEA